MSYSYKLKTLTVSAIKWTGQNADEVINFLTARGYGEVSMERRPDTPMLVKVGSGYLKIEQGQYVSVDEKLAVDTHSAIEFENTFEKIPEGHPETEGVNNILSHFK